MKKGLLATVVLTVLVLSSVSASDRWPQFRGSDAGVPPITRRCPTRGARLTMSYGGSTSLVWGGARRSSGAITSSSRPRSARAWSRSRSRGLYDPGDLHGKRAAVAAQRWMVYDIDFKTGKIRWERELREAVPTIKRHIKASFASETPVTDGERVYVYSGSIGLVAALDMTGRSSGVGTLVPSTVTRSSPRPRRRCFTRTVCISSATTRPSRFWSRSTPGRANPSVASRSGRDRELGQRPLVWENELRTEIVTTGRNKVRSYDLDGTGVVGTPGHDGERRADAVRQGRTGLPQLGLSWIVRSPRVCDPPGWIR